jgi:GIY-YIG catalytic domain
MKKNLIYKIKNEFRSFYGRNKSDIAKPLGALFNDDSRLNVVPLVSYPHADKYKSEIYEENERKCGIYRWNNLITGKSYIGSSVNLRGRFGNYYSKVYLKRRVELGTSIIYNSILKYEMKSFSLDILEYCDPSTLLSR